VLPDTELRPFQVVARQPAEDTLDFSALPEIGDKQRAGVLLLADPFTFPTREYLDVLNERLPGVPVVGGMASGGNGPGQNFLITERGVEESGAVGVVVEGATEIRSVVSQGCRPVGKPYVITACKEHFILKLGGKPAVTVLMETMQALSAADRALLQSGAFIGLAVDPKKSTFERGDFIVRGLMGLDPKQGSIAVADNALRVGQTVQFLVRDAASAGEDLVQLMKQRTGDVGAASQIGALLFSCNGRGTRLFAQRNHDITCVQSAFESRVPAAGFFAMGEIGPIGGRNFLHGFTASVALFRERR
jgi:small ligand-binding sensory domain FIST